MKQNSNSKKILFIGFGNPGRRDDGMGPLLADEVEKLNLPFVTVDSDYQLTVEDAHTVSQHDIVIFADADVSADDPYYFKELVPDVDPGFSSHSVAPASVLGYAHVLFKSQTRGYLLGVRGYEYDEFGEGLSDRAKINFEQARKFICDKLQRWSA